MPFTKSLCLRAMLVIAPAFLFSSCTTASVWDQYLELNECAGIRFFISNYPRDSGISSAKAELARCGDLRKSDGMSSRYEFISEDVHEYHYGITFRESMGTAVTLDHVRARTVPKVGSCDLGWRKIEPLVIPANGEVRYEGVIRTERDKPWCMEGSFDGPLVMSFSGRDTNGHKIELRIHMGTGELFGF
jgi:hypothetical protein